MSEICLILHDIRSTHNVGSLYRTAEGLGINKLYLTGYTPHPTFPGDTRLPHISMKLTNQIHKTALGAEELVNWEYRQDIANVLDELKADGYHLTGLEQSDRAVSLAEFRVPAKVALLLGREVEGIDPALQAQCDSLLEIPMYGKKESFNVVQAAAIALYILRES